MIRKNIGLCKRNWKRKFVKKRKQYENDIESHFTYNMRRVWNGMKLMSRWVNGNKQKIASVNTAGEVNELNQFFNRFDSHHFLQKNIGRFMIFWTERLLRRMTFKGSIQTRTRFGACFSMWIPTKPLAQITLHQKYLRHVLDSLLTFFCIIFNACFSTNTFPTTTVIRYFMDLWLSYK